MDADFWHERWTSKQIPFHEGEANHLLVKWCHRLELAPGARVFVPLCGKTRDIAWLLSSGFRVVGVELSEIAVRELFDELGAEPTITEAGGLRRYEAPNLDVFVGDFFRLTPEWLGNVDAIYDRAALVALPEAMRIRYATHLVELTDAAPQFTICFEYDQATMRGPPFAIDRRLLERCYGDHYQLESLESGPVGGGLKGIGATEHAWLLRTKASA